MQSLANQRKRSFTIVALLSLALLFALPIAAGAQEMAGDSVYISIRQYDGLNPADFVEGLRIAREGFVPLIRSSDGFIAYYVVQTSETTMSAINVFETREQALASNEQAREFVVENLAPLLPNPPRTFEGAVNIGFVELLDGMADGDVSSLHAGIRVYDGFEADDLDEFVAIVEDGFLPIMRETDGFFGYYLMNTGAGEVAAVSIFDTEASAMASNEKASDFVAEHLTAFLPNAPLAASGRVSIAVLADLNDGADLMDDTSVDAVFASVRVYDGVNPADQNEIRRLVEDGFLPIMRESDGFVGYYLLPAEDMLAAISLFESAEQAAASTDKARDFVATSLAPLLPNPPLIVEGAVELSTQLMLDMVHPGDLIMPLHALLAIYDGFDMARLDEAVALIESDLLPDLREIGLFSYHGISDGLDKAVALRIMDSAESLRRGADIAADFVAEYLADWLAEDPLVVDGRLGVASVEAILEGLNLAQYGVDETSVFASVRLYDGIDPADQDEIARLTVDGFLPIIRESAGFVGYFFLPVGDGLATVSLFDSAQQASASNDAAREFIVQNVAPLLPNPPKIFEGSLSINYVSARSEAAEHDSPSDLYASIRLYEGFDLAHFDEANDLAIAHLLPALQEAGGLFAQFALNDGADTVVGISVFDSEEGSLAANDAGKAFTTEYLTDWAPNPPTGIAGKLAIAALAAINMGDNLAGAMMEG